MELWSYQSPDFSLVEGKVHPAKSRFAHDYPAAYKRLWECVGTDQFVWCCTAPKPSGWHGSCEWVLEVPTGEFFRIVDSMVWNGILGLSVAPPECLRSKLVWAASEKYPTDRAAQRISYEEEVEKLLHPPGDPWASLFLTDPNDPRADVLLRHPVKRSWVASNGLATR